MRRTRLVVLVVLLATAIYVPMPAQALSLFGESARLVKIMDPAINLSVFMVDPRSGETEIFVEPAKEKCGEDGIRIAQNSDPVEQGLIVVVKATGGLGDKSLTLPTWRLDMRDMVLSKDQAKCELVSPPEPGDSVTDWIRYNARSRPARDGGFRPFATSKPPFYAVYDSRNGVEGDCVSIELFVRQRKGFGAAAVVSFYVANSHDNDTGERLDMDDRPIAPPWPEGLWGGGREYNRDLTAAERSRLRQEDPAGYGEYWQQRREERGYREDALPAPAPKRQPCAKQPPQPTVQPQVQIMDQQGQEPDVDVDQLAYASQLEETARCVGYQFHLLQFVPAFDAAGCTQRLDGERITQPLLVFFVSRDLQLLKQEKMYIWKQTGGRGQFVRLAFARTKEWEKSFLFISDARPGDVFAPEYRGNVCRGVRITAGCGVWYPVTVE